MISSLSIIPQVQKGIEDVEKMMLSQADQYHSDLKSALTVLLSSGGKRIRPRLILLLGNLFQGDYETLVTLAASIELLHTATLVHDDLIDGAVLRRGVPTLNSKWSSTATVLTGDFIFACAALQAAKTNSIKVMSLFSETLRIIVNGEVNQLFSSRCNTNKEDYYRRIYAKTASLFETSTYSAAIISNVPNTVANSVREFGKALGMAFQIVDDVLDYSGDQGTTGKPVGEDLKQGLITLPMLYYIKNNPKDVDVLSISDGNCLDNDDLIERLVSKVTASSAIDESLQEAKKYSQAAIDHLSLLPDSLEKEELISLATYSVMRVN